MNYVEFQDYFKWQLDVDVWSLSDNICNLLIAADMLQEYKLSIRQCAAECMISKSTLHNFISNGSLRYYSYELYCLCRKQLDWNKTHAAYFKRKFRR